MNEVIINFTTDNHSSIICPLNENDTTIIAIKDYCLELIQQAPALMAPLHDESTTILFRLCLADEYDYFEIDMADEELSILIRQLLYQKINNKPYEIRIKIIDEASYIAKLTDLKSKPQDLKTKDEIFETQRYLDCFESFKKIIATKIQLTIKLNSFTLADSSNYDAYIFILKTIVKFHQLVYSGIISTAKANRGTKLEGYVNIDDTCTPIKQMVFPFYLNEKEMQEAFERNGNGMNFTLFYNSLHYKNHYMLAHFFTSDFLNDRIIPYMIDALYTTGESEKELFALNNNWNSISNYYVGLA